MVNDRHSYHFKLNTSNKLINPVAIKENLAKAICSQLNELNIKIRNILSIDKQIKEMKTFLLESSINDMKPLNSLCNLKGCAYKENQLIFLRTIKKFHQDNKNFKCNKDGFIDINNYCQELAQALTNKILEASKQSISQVKNVHQEEMKLDLDDSINATIHHHKNRCCDAPTSPPTTIIYDKSIKHAVNIATQKNIVGHTTIYDKKDFLSNRDEIFKFYSKGSNDLYTLFSIDPSGNQQQDDTKLASVMNAVENEVANMAIQ